MANNFNDVLKSMEETDRHLKNAEPGDDHIIDLSDTQRIKVLSPGRLVTKRFLRNKLAIIGLCILVIMFLFSFIGPLFYPYGQTDIFYKYDYLRVSYAQATERTDYSGYSVDDTVDVHYSVKNMMTSYILKMNENALKEMIVTGTDGSTYRITELGHAVYTLDSVSEIEVAEFSGLDVVSKYNKKIDIFTHSVAATVGFETAFSKAVASEFPGFWSDGEYYFITSDSKNTFEAKKLSTGEMTYFDANPGTGFLESFSHGIENGFFDHNDVHYLISGDHETMRITTYGDSHTVMVYSLFVFDVFDENIDLSNDLKANALLALYGEDSFALDGEQYTVVESDEGSVIFKNGTEHAAFSTFVVRRYTGEDTLSMDFKRTAEHAISQAMESEQLTATFTYALPQMDSEGNYLIDENGEYGAVDTEIKAEFKVGSWVLTCEQITHLIDIYGPSSKEHRFGTDADGFDVLSRMMYGGRISLMVGFVVVILEILLGVLMGGIAGYFGGWVDTLIMRMVDVFYCIPTYPILIILGAFFDSIKMGSYIRLMWMMVVMGILGWAPVARLVRGQILSLREQEFMTAAESTGISTRRKIFRHLIPNVMPQLIVSATMGLGSVIITESTLSFLGLGVKHPLATWGTMINSITSSNENLIRYAHIWIPVGLLICLTVIAFNFVGDGLRDAFDPKMKQ
jgi:peptide/nickel transport system permease protein